jgi:hypothetical protein
MQILGIQFNDFHTIFRERVILLHLFMKLFQILRKNCKTDRLNTKVSIEPKIYHPVQCDKRYNGIQKMK